MLALLIISIAELNIETKLLSCWLVEEPVFCKVSVFSMFSNIATDTIAIVAPVNDKFLKYSYDF